MYLDLSSSGNFWWIIHRLEITIVAQSTETSPRIVKPYAFMIIKINQKCKWLSRTSKTQSLTLYPISQLIEIFYYSLTPLKI